ncbi:MAG TPA: thioredoxin domain-containing protein [Candidatus Acidoferrales bacterium]|nr:thioredoxin domain-containing protein [Candidatus Acidoferrales bacterium]
MTLPGRSTNENPSRHHLRTLGIASAAAFLCLLPILSVQSVFSQTPAELARFTAEKSLGNPNAPIKMEVFDDYECPTCDEFYENTLKVMIDTYVAEGKVYLIHRDFPIPGHLYSRRAARWVNAAARIGKFEAVERALFDNQMAWSEYGTENPKGVMEPFVKEALTPAEFERVQRLMKGCLVNTQEEIKGCALDADIQHDVALGELIPVNGTPTSIITHRGERYPPIVGAMSWPLLREFFDQLLSQK